MGVVLKVDMRDAPVAELAAQAATLRATGLGVNSIITQIKDETGWPLTKTFYEKRLETHEIYQKTYNIVEKGIIAKNVNKYRVRASGILDKVYDVLMKALEEGDLKAVPLVLKSVGIDLPEQEQKQAQNIQVFLPGVKREKDVSEN